MIRFGPFCWPQPRPEINGLGFCGDLEAWKCLKMNALMAHKTQQ